MVGEADMNYDPISGEPRFANQDVHDPTYEFAKTINQPNTHQIKSNQKSSSNPGQRRHHPNNAIDRSYDQWNRFENFLKFAQKKEVRDRLKDFDAPDVSNYIDADTVDKITAERNPKALAGTLNKNKHATGKKKDEKQKKKEI